MFWGLRALSKLVIWCSRARPRKNVAIQIFWFCKPRFFISTGKRTCARYLTYTCDALLLEAFFHTSTSITIRFKKRKLTSFYESKCQFLVECENTSLYSVLYHMRAGRLLAAMLKTRVCLFSSWYEKSWIQKAINLNVHFFEVLFSKNN